MLKAAIIGLGNWGRVLVDSVQGRSERIRFVAAATRTPGRAAAYAARQGIELLPDLDAVLARADIEAVVLATPHSQHGAQIAAAARAGRHVFCEKGWDFGAFDMERAELEAFAGTVAGAGAWPVQRDEALAAIALFEAICKAAETPGTRLAVAAG